MIKDKIVKLVLNPANRKRLQERGYVLPVNPLNKDSFLYGSVIDVRIEDLSPTCKVRVTNICDICSSEKIISFFDAKRQGTCRSCLFSGEKNPMFGISLPGNKVNDKPISMEQAHLQCSKGSHHLVYWACPRCKTEAIKTYKTALTDKLCKPCNNIVRPKPDFSGDKNPAWKTGEYIGGFVKIAGMRPRLSGIISVIVALNVG